VLAHAVDMAGRVCHKIETRQPAQPIGRRTMARGQQQAQAGRRAGTRGKALGEQFGQRVRAVAGRRFV
jgi:hypothetical protein